MDPNQLLLQLRDIHSPEPIGAWPPAIGWWILTIISTVVVVLLSFYIIRWYKKNAWRRAAIKEFKTLRAVYLTEPSAANLSAISSLMKRSLASLRSDSHLLTLTGEQWAAQLIKPNLSSKQPNLNDREISLLTQGIYIANCDSLEENELSRIEKWIKGLK